MSSKALHTEAGPELIGQCKKGNNDAFKQIYGLYKNAMFSICMRMLNNRGEAEDVLQESFISAFNSIGRFSGQSSFGAWLKRIVINRCIDSLRKRNIYAVPLGDTELAEEELTDDEHVTYDIEAVKKAIGLLPDGYRVILTLFLFEDYTHRMIADKLGISEGTSKSQYSRSRKRLVELIKKMNDER